MLELEDATKNYKDFEVAYKEFEVCLSSLNLTTVNLKLLSWISVSLLKYLLIRFDFDKHFKRKIYD